MTFGMTAKAIPKVWTYWHQEQDLTLREPLRFTAIQRFDVCRFATPISRDSASEQVGGSNPFKSRTGDKFPASFSAAEVN
jgi:hypothetical protein